MKKIYLAYFVAICLLSCHTKNDLEEEILVIHQTFNHVTPGMSENDFHDMMRFGPKFPPPGSKPAPLKDTTRKAGKHIYQVVDSLFNLNRFKYGPKKANSELERLLITGGLKSQFAKLTKNSKDYQFVKTSDSSVYQNKDFNGRLFFSRVVFNKDRTQACYYFEHTAKISESRNWAMGTLIFAAKKNGKWIFVREEEMWIV